MTNHEVETVNDDDITVRYQQARALMNGFSNQQLVQNDTIFPVWIGETGCFWYERTCRLFSIIHVVVNHKEVAHMQHILSMFYSWCPRGT